MKLCMETIDSCMTYEPYKPKYWTNLNDDLMMTLDEHHQSGYNLSWGEHKWLFQFNGNWSNSWHVSVDQSGGPTEWPTPPTKTISLSPSELDHPLNSLIQLNCWVYLNASIQAELRDLYCHNALDVNTSHKQLQQIQYNRWHGNPLKH